MRHAQSNALTAMSGCMGSSLDSQVQFSAFNGADVPFECPCLGHHSDGTYNWSVPLFKLKNDPSPVTGLHSGTAGDTHDTMQCQQRLCLLVQRCLESSLFLFGSSVLVSCSRVHLCGLVKYSKSKCQKLRKRRRQFHEEKKAVAHSLNTYC